MFDYVINSIPTTPAFAWIGFIFTFLGVPLGAYGIIFRNKKTLSFTEIDKKIIDESLINNFDITIFKNDIHINNLAVIEFYFWNSGNVDIPESDFIDGKIDLVLFDKYVNILSAQYCASTTLSNNSTIVVRDNLITFKPRIFKANEGFYIKLIHDSSTNYITPELCVNGVKEPKFIQPELIFLTSTDSHYNKNSRFSNESENKVSLIKQKFVDISNSYKKNSRLYLNTFNFTMSIIIYMYLFYMLVELFRFLIGKTADPNFFESMTIFIFVILLYLSVNIIKLINKKKKSLFNDLNKKKLKNIEIIYSEEFKSNIKLMNEINSDYDLLILKFKNNEITEEDFYTGMYHLKKKYGDIFNVHYDNIFQNLYNE